MIDWLRRSSEPPALDLAGRTVPIVLRRHARATRMTLRLAPDGSEIRVTLPRWGRTADAVDFARSRSDWLENQMARVPDAIPPVPGGTLHHCGHALRIVWSPGLPRKPRIEDGRILAGGPEAGLAARLRRWLEAEALTLMGSDLSHYCSRAQVATPVLRLSRAQRRWGSCAGDGTIRLNWRLVQAPEAVRRSVVAHEVAHLVHFDHSPAFHALLNDLFDGDLAAANGWLKREGRSLYTAFG
ncbi:metal-dependent hydrolase [Croceicoccus estronivorus]|uniref:M48 family metallopeptidase n=1 Tax=Croceicoccus estronivorus TaxID=1172626 RepID=UPI0008307290|nr:SprT family zinc-dependent metalloprotease [Croceicoccus estronivorus]OCC22434.1 metal-dependent hydrolase [Croceicoccus estronivorus]